MNNQNQNKEITQIMKDENQELLPLEERLKQQHEELDRLAKEKRERRNPENLDAGWEKLFEESIKYKKY